SACTRARRHAAGHRAEIRRGRRHGLFALFRRLDRGADAGRHDALCLDRRAACASRPPTVTVVGFSTWLWTAPKIKRRRSCLCASIPLIFKSNSACSRAYFLDAILSDPVCAEDFGEGPIMTDAASKNFIDLTANIVSAYLSNNPTPAADIPGLISQIHAALVRVSSGRTEAPLEPAKPAVSIKKSISPDYIVCLEDGKRFKSLKRHLRTQYNMTPEQYRDKWGLPPD